MIDHRIRDTSVTDKGVDELSSPLEHNFTLTQANTLHALSLCFLASLGYITILFPELHLDNPFRFS
jgi:hypothetical protein